MKKYYRITSIERNKTYHGSTFWDAGYHYEYTPIAAGHEFMFKKLSEFNDTFKHKNQEVKIDIKHIFDRQQSVVIIKGKKNVVNEFITQLLLTDFSNHFTFKECPYWDVNYKSYL